MILLVAIGAAQDDLEKHYADLLVATMKADYRSPIPRILPGKQETRQRLCSLVKLRGGDEAVMQQGRFTAVKDSDFVAQVRKQSFQAEKIRLGVWKDDKGQTWIAIEEQFRRDWIEYTPFVDGCFWNPSYCAKPKLNESCKSVE